MKNNRLTNNEICELRQIADRLRELASLENASFGMNTNEDLKVKESIKPYMSWFTSQAYRIDAVLNDEFKIEY